MLGGHKMTLLDNWATVHQYFRNARTYMIGFINTHKILQTYPGGGGEINASDVILMFHCAPPSRWPRDVRRQAA
jgi:hypothetical protein